MTMPDDRQYAKTHEWVKIDGQTATVGITDHAQSALGDITFVEPPAPGRTVTQGAECGVIESVKAASDLFAPVSGQVTETNGDLARQPELINQDPYGKGWLFKLAKVDVSQLGALMSAKEYAALLEQET